MEKSLDGQDPNMTRSSESKQKKRLVFPGTFDPFTVGHLSIAQRAAGICDELVVAVFDNRNKRPVMKRADRAGLIRKALAAIPFVTVAEFDGLLVDFCRQEDIGAIVRGIRDPSQFEEEQTMAEINRRIGHGIETVFLPAWSDLRHVSSSAVREIVKLGGDVSDFVPGPIKADILSAYADKSRGGENNE